MTDTENKENKEDKENNENINIIRSISPVNQIFSCGICLELFTKKQRYPISLNCGHTFCYNCIKRLGFRKKSIMCGLCRKHTFSTYKRLGKNVLLLEILEMVNLLEKDDENIKKSNSPPSNSDEDNHSTNSSLALVPANNQLENSLWISNNEIEELYDMFDRIHQQCLILQNSTNFIMTERYRDNLTNLRDSLEDIEQNLSETRRDFYLIVSRASDLMSTVNDAATNTHIEPEYIYPIHSRRQSQRRGFYDSNNLFYNTEFPLISNYFNPIVNNYHEDEEILRLNFLRQTSDRTSVNCYLCNVFFLYTSHSIQQHINGRRHREFLLSRLDNISNESRENRPIPDNSEENNQALVPFSWSSRSRSSLPSFLGIQDNDRIETSIQNLNEIFSTPITGTTTSATSATLTISNSENNQNNNENFQTRLLNLINESRTQRPPFPYDPNYLNIMADYFNNNRQNNLTFYNSVSYNYNNGENNFLRNFSSNNNGNNFNNNSNNNRQYNITFYNRTRNNQTNRNNTNTDTNLSRDNNDNPSTSNLNRRRRYE